MESAAKWRMTVTHGFCGLNHTHYFFIFSPETDREKIETAHSWGSFGSRGWIILVLFSQVCDGFDTPSLFLALHPPLPQNKLLNRLISPSLIFRILKPAADLCEFSRRPSGCENDWSEQQFACFRANVTMCAAAYFNEAFLSDKIIARVKNLATTRPMWTIWGSVTRCGLAGGIAHTLSVRSMRFNASSRRHSERKGSKPAARSSQRLNK